jgi:hypothetical protein
MIRAPLIHGLDLSPLYFKVWSFIGTRLWAAVLDTSVSIMHSTLDIFVLASDLLIQYEHSYCHCNAQKTPELIYSIDIMQNLRFPVMAASFMGPAPDDTW